MKKLTLLLPLAFSCGAATAQAPPALSAQQEKNLVAFAHLYGYVQYFHPSDEAQKVAWRMVSLKGSRQMLAVQNDQELIKTLNDLFQPLGPSIRVFPTSQRLTFDPAMVQPPAPAPATKVVSWQHQGLRTSLFGYGQSFHNVRLNRPSKETSTFAILKDIDISRFAGQPYEVVVTTSAREGGHNLTFELAHNQVLAETYIPSATQHFTQQKLTPQSQRRTFTGTFAATARSLDATLIYPPALLESGVQDAHIDTEIFVFIEGKKVRLPTTPAKANQATKQEIELTISSGDLPAKPLFAEQLHLGDHLGKEIAPGISCIVPLAVAGDAPHTYPVGDSLQLEQLHVRAADWDKYPAEWNKYVAGNALTLPEVRMSNIVNAWNCVRHGYAYWSSASATPEALLPRALRSAYQDSTYAGFYHTLQEMMAPLNDGHAFVSSIKPPPSLGVPLAVGKAENQVVVTQVLAADLAPQVRPGDIVMAIDGVPAADVLRERASLVSGSPQNKECRALAKLLNGPATPLDLTLRRGRSTWHLRVPRSQATPAPATQRADKWLAPGIYYYNMATYGKPFTAQNYDTLARAKAVIFDVRGYPGEGIMDVVNMLLKAPAEATFMYNLDMLRPDQEGLRLSPNVGHYTPDPRHLSGKMYFLTDANTQSYPETFLALIRGFKLGTLVGQPTSGANGNVSGYSLQGGLSISYSGLYVQNIDGSRHHAIGIKPDVLVTPTLEAIRNGQDLTLETALNLAKAGK